MPVRMRGRWVCSRACQVDRGRSSRRPPLQCNHWVGPANPHWAPPAHPHPRTSHGPGHSWPPMYLHTPLKHHVIHTHNTHTHAHAAVSKRTFNVKLGSYHTMPLMKPRTHVGACPGTPHPPTLPRCHACTASGIHASTSTIQYLRQCSVFCP